jgi:hypothetical protein
MSHRTSPVNANSMSLLGTAASSVMAWLGSVAPGGLYATMQSAAMGGYGASVAAGAAQAGAVASSALGYIWCRGN